MHYRTGRLESATDKKNKIKKISLIKAFRRTRKKEKSRDTFSSAACPNRLRSAEHNPELRN